MISSVIPRHSTLLLKIAWLTVMVIGFVASAYGAELNGFLQLTWGASLDDAKREISSRSGARLNRHESDANRLRFDGGKFAGFKVDRIDISFASGRFFRAEVRLEAASKEHQKEFSALKALLSEKYGPPGRDEATRKEATWYFPVPGKPANLINLAADPKGTGVLIFYMSENSKIPVAKIAAEQAPAKPVRTPSGAKDDL